MVAKLFLTTMNNSWSLNLFKFAASEIKIQCPNLHQITSLQLTTTIRTTLSTKSWLSMKTKTTASLSFSRLTRKHQAHIYQRTKTSKTSPHISLVAQCRTWAMNQKNPPGVPLGRQYLRPTLLKHNHKMRQTDMATKSLNHGTHHKKRYAGTELTVLNV